MNDNSKSPPAILVVNDDADARFLISRSLREKIPEAVVVEAESASEALQVIKDRVVNLVISDNRMPGGSGLDMITKLRNEGATLPIIVASCATEIEAEAKRAGANAYFGEANYARLPALVTSLLRC